MKKNIISTVLLMFVVLGSMAQQKNIVLELFTSQGCSSCPRADKLLEEVAANANYKNVIALAYHVDYWNRLGWKDPFSKAAYSNYQQEYGRKFGGRSIYTPQLVINGKKHIVGSDVASLTNSLSNLKHQKLSIPITIKNVQKTGDKITLNYSSPNNLVNRLSVVMLLKEQVTQVKRGENRNRTLLDTHIVVGKKVIQEASTEGAITFEEVTQNLNELEFVAYLQKDNLEVVGATQWQE